MISLEGGSFYSILLPQDSVSPPCLWAWYGSNMGDYPAANSSPAKGGGEAFATAATIYSELGFDTPTRLF